MRQISLLAIALVGLALLISAAEAAPQITFSTDWYGGKRDLGGFKVLEKRAPGWGKRAPGWGKRAPGWGKRSESESTDDSMSRVETLSEIKHSYEVI